MPDAEPKAPLAKVNASMADMVAKLEELDADLAKPGLAELPAPDSDEAWKGYPALLRACFDASDAELPGVLTRLLAEGADPNAPSRYGETPVRQCFARGAFSAVRLLIEHGADISDFDWSEDDLAIAMGDVPDIKAGAPALTRRDGGGRTPLLQAIRFANLAAAQHLEAITPAERKIVAYHEMGHALVSLALPGMDAVHKVSIIPRGIGALGYTIQRPTEDRFLMTESELRDKIAVLMGGRAAEQLVFGHLSTGAADDLARATDIARSMVARYGMDAELGGVSYDTERSSFLGDRPPGYLERNYSEATANAMDTAVRTVLREVLQQALEILTDNRDILERAASRLLEVETLDEAALRDLTQDLRKGAAGKAKVAMNG